MKKNQDISEFQETLKELEAIGEFSEEELTWLKTISGSLDDIKDELNEDVFTVQLTNLSNNPYPEFKNGALTVLSSQKIIFQPMETRIIPTGLKLVLPHNITVLTETHSQFVSRTTLCIGHFLKEDMLYLVVSHLNNFVNTIEEGEPVAILKFVYSLDEKTIQLKSDKY